MELLKRNISIAWSAILQNPLRSFLTILGVVFGVASVISLIAIGKGTQLQLLQQMQAIGTNQLIIQHIPKAPPTSQSTQASEEPLVAPPNPLDQSLTHAISQVLFPYCLSSLEQNRECDIQQQYHKTKVKIVGVEPTYFEINTLEREIGFGFSPQHFREGAPVCIIGHRIAVKLFSTQNPIGKYLKCGNTHLKVIGVLKPKNLDTELAQEIGIMSSDQCIYTPYQTFRLRLTKSLNKQNESEASQQKVIVKVKDSDQIPQVVQVLNRMLKRKYPNQKFKTVIPNDLIAEKQKTKELFGQVLALIAIISLIVGGVGVTNIMYANVSERQKEIGIRRVIGASQKDITFQFLLEAIMLCMVGAAMGLVLGAGICWAVTRLTGIPTIISLGSVFLSCLLVILVGIIFGIKPALKASAISPIEAIRSY